MKLTKPTVNQIWTSLIGYRLAVSSTKKDTTAVVSLDRDTPLPDSQGSAETLSPPQSQDSQTVTLTGQGFRPSNPLSFNRSGTGIFEVSVCLR